MAGPARRDLAFVIPMRTKLDALVRHRDAALDELRLHYVEAGPDDRDAPTIVLLHGFPDFWYGWRYQLVALAEAGVRVLAPDLRGYDRSDKPSSVAAYAVRPLVQDIVQLLERTCSAPPLLVGHDWGGILAWWTAMLAPHCIDRLAIVNAPHPAQLRTAMTRPAQALRLWYVLYFQLPWVPERLLARDGHAPLLETLRRYGVIVTDDDRTRYAEAFAQGSLNAMLNYYRALGRPRALRELAALRPIDHPTLVLWGERDPVLLPALAHPPDRWVRDARVERIASAGHWPQIDCAERFTRHLLEWRASTGGDRIVQSGAQHGAHDQMMKGPNDVEIDRTRPMSIVHDRHE